MIKEISMPMMAPVGGGSLSGLAWEDIPAAGPVDIQSGRNVYIELTEDKTCTKASAGKILQFIKEGFMPVLKTLTADGPDSVTKWLMCDFTIGPYDSDSQITFYSLHTVNPTMRLAAFSDALDKPFTVVARISSSDEGGGQTNN